MSLSELTTAARLRLADPGEAADLAAFLTRLLRFDRAAAVRLQSGSGERAGALAVFGRLPLGGTGVLAIRTARLAEPGEAHDRTVSAGELLESLDTEAATVGLPKPVTGPAWTGLLPPRTGWQPLAEPAVDQVIPQLLAGIAEFRQRSEAVPEQHRSRQVLDALADEIWSRPLTAAPALPLRAAHAAYAVGFLKPDVPLTAHRAGSWLRLNAPAGSIAVRSKAAPGAGLGLSPLS